MSKRDLDTLFLLARAHRNNRVAPRLQGKHCAQRLSAAKAKRAKGRIKAGRRARKRCPFDPA